MLIDAHLDMAYNAMVLRRDLRLTVDVLRAQEAVTPPPGQHTGACLVTLPALRAGGVRIIGGSLFVAPAWKQWAEEAQVYHTAEEAHVQAQAQLDYYRRLADEEPDVRLLQTRADLDAVCAADATESPLLGIFVVMEGAAPIREPAEVGRWVERGLRGVGLTWSAGTRYAGGNGNPGPLTDDGRELLKQMASFNLLLDISHLWEDAAFDVLDRYPGPVVATHANPRAFVNTPRMLNDALLRGLAERGGVTGIVPYNRMLDMDWRVGQPRTPLSRVVEVVDYVCQLLGSAAHVGIGSDFDGGFGMEAAPEGLDSIADLGQIGALLRARGYAESDVRAILSDNWLRIFGDVLGAF